ncbi:MAG TPA: OsmC family protein [Egibacteraceae bacterium]|nr:OsmC family protein [Egibacteraceae bacterium]
MSDTKTMTDAKTAVAARNGVDAETLFATLDAVKDQRELAAFQFRARNRWISGTHSQSTSQGFHGAGGEHSHQRTFVFDADHPAVLVGKDNGPAPVEFLLYALASCLTAGVANIASVRGVALTRVESTIEGDIDLHGLLGMSDEVRNGYQRVRVRFTIEGDAPPEKLREIVEQSKARSAVYDVITNQVPVDIEIVA